MITYPLIDPVFLKLGPLEFRWYGLAYVLGLFLPFLIFRKEFEQRFKMNSEDRSTLMLYIMLGIILGGRLGYVFIYNFTETVTNPLSIIMLNKGGMSYHGGAIGAMVAMLFYAKKYNKAPLQLLDILGIFSTIGIGLGRLANFINAELYGRVTTVSWGMIFPGAGPFPRHPSQLYEAFFEGLVLFLILFFIKKKNSLKDGQLFATYVFLYGLFRFFIEFTREPDAHIGFIFSIFSLGQLLCFIWMVIGAGLFLNLYYSRQPAKKRKP